MKNFVCPYCDFSNPIPPHYVGKEVKCKKCAKVFFAPIAPTIAPAAVSDHDDGAGKFGEIKTESIRAAGSLFKRVKDQLNKRHLLIRGSVFQPLFGIIATIILVFAAIFLVTAKRVNVKIESAFSEAEALNSEITGNILSGQHRAAKDKLEKMKTLTQQGSNLTRKNGFFS